MSRGAISIAVAAAVLLSGAFAAHAKVRSYESLSPVQLTALQLSEQRLAQDNVVLSHVERDFCRHKLSAREFANEQRDLVSFIAEEAQFQNAILVKPPGLSQGTRDVLVTIGKYAVLVPAYLLEAALKAGPSLANAALR